MSLYLSLLTSVLHDYLCSQALPSLYVICILRFPILEIQILSLHPWQTTISTYDHCKVITTNLSCTSLQNQQKLKKVKIKTHSHKHKNLMEAI